MPFGKLENSRNSMVVLGAQTTTDWRRLMDESSARMLTSLIDPVGPWRSWERASMASRRSWVRIPSAPPKIKGSGPDTWVTECTGYIGNNLGPNGLPNGFQDPRIKIEVSQIIIH